MPRKTDDPMLAEASPTTASPDPSGERVFDFTQPLDSMDAETKSVYYRLRRVALTMPDGEYVASNGRGDANQLPDGKTYTEAQVIEILGEDYATGIVINKKCCN